MGVQWTEEQNKVITLRNRNILVAAAAGSGKTAVLVERIIRMLTDPRQPVDVDRLLIVTFTEAAAGEMKERIRNAIEKELQARPEDVHLQRQSTLIHSAKITTIHSFCLTVIREHFHVIDLDPGFRIGEEGELKLLKRDVLEEVLEERYARGGQDFLDMTEKLASGRTDKKLEERILQLYEYSRSYPQPERWLASCGERYRMEEEGGEGQGEIFTLAAKRIIQYVEGACTLTKQAIALCTAPDGPEFYLDAFYGDLEKLEDICKENSFQRIYYKVKDLKWKTLSSKKSNETNAELRERAKKIREQVKKIIKDIRENWFYEEPEEIRKDMMETWPVMRTFAQVVEEFAQAFAAKKAERNMIDFTDMEQFALQILTEEKEGALVPSAVAREYQEQFQEVMIDEYQDSNLIQEAILTSVSRVSRGSHNIFMVGDVKQSIYRFRLSRPELFMDKYQSYPVEDGECQRIDLHKNFRSREEVLGASNYVFRRIMRGELGGVLYDDQAALYPGASFPEDPEGSGAGKKAELILLDSSDEDEDTPRQFEARAVARRIRQLMQGERVLDKATGEMRPLRYGDIVILTRSIKGWADVFGAVLAEEGIPAHADSREGYFETWEVSVLLDYLKLLDNQRQDIPLGAVLSSPFGNFSPEDLARIRGAYPEKTFFAAAEAMAEADSPLGKRLRKFYDTLENFREQIPYLPIHRLLWQILDQTGYGMYMEAMPGGAQRKANLDMLVEKASSFERTSYKGLFHFVRYIEQLKKYEVDYGEANLTDEQEDTVRIMSIHKSKGLEFPVVFVSGLGKRFNMQDINSPVVIHPDFGVGLDAVDLEQRTKISTILKNLIRQELKLETLGEELRVLYVAMTRAKEKLILTGQGSGLEERLARYKEDAIGAPASEETGESLSYPFYLLAEAKCYLDWILPVAAEKTAPISTAVQTSQDLVAEGIISEAAEGLAGDVLEHWDTNRPVSEEMASRLREQLDWQYPFYTEQTQRLKFTVSELKKREWLAEESGEMLQEEPEVVPLVPEFLKEQEALAGASRGTAYHKLLELLDFSKSYDKAALAKEIGRLQKEGYLSEETAKCIRITDILGFISSSAGQRMHQAAKESLLYKEQPFVLGVDASEIYPKEKSGEIILVQGIIDVYFEEPDGLVLLDYKTDRVQKGEELKDRYHAQLEYYAKALEQLREKPVKEKLIYSFALGQEINL